LLSELQVHRGVEDQFSFFLRRLDELWRDRGSRRRLSAQGLGEYGCNG
jgi:hypothetical protein